MFAVCIGDYEIRCQASGLLRLLPTELEEAKLVDRFGDKNAHASTCCFTLKHKEENGLLLVVIQESCRCDLGFFPGAIIVPESNRVYLGAGQRLLGYSILNPRRLWERRAKGGFYSWGRFGNIVIMAAELELVAMNIIGKKLWSRSVAPPWDHFVTEADNLITIRDFNSIRALDLTTGRRAIA